MNSDTAPRATPIPSKVQRPRLRAKTGCTTCRDRRKKCDEQKPICGDCTRLDLACSWRDEDSSALRTPQGKVFAGSLEVEVYKRIKRGPASQASLSLVTFSEVYPRFRGETEHRVMTETPKILSMLICPTAGQDCRNFSQFISVSLQEPWIRDALSAFALTIISTQTPDQHLKYPAARSYQSAIVGLREHMTDCISRVQYQMLLVSANFLGLTETLCYTNPESAIHHFAAVSRLLTLEANRGWVNLGGPIATLYRIIAECAIYNISTLSLFYKDVDFLVSTIDWNSIEGYFALPALSETPDYYTSPFLGGRRDIYRLVLLVTWLSRQELSADVRERQVLGVELKLEEFQKSLPTFYEDGVPETVADAEYVKKLYTAKHQLYVLALHIFIAKIARPEMCAASADIAKYFRQSILLLKSADLLEYGNPALCWPLHILLCAADKDEDFSALIDQARAVQNVLDKGHASRLAKVVSLVETHRQNRSGACQAEAGSGCRSNHDGLNLLLQKDGLLG